MILGTDFRFRDDFTDSETIPIEVLTGPYTGVIFRIQTVNIREDVDSAKLTFSYELLEHPNFREKVLREDVRFNEHVGLVINTLVLDLADDLDRHEGMDESTGREDYFEESDTGS